MEIINPVNMNAFMILKNLISPALVNWISIGSCLLKGSSFLLYSILWYYIYLFMLYL